MLPNLNELIKPICAKIEQFNVLDCSLPVSFTSSVKQINKNTVQYGNSASCITNRNGQHIFLSNNWFYIAAILSPLYGPFCNYKKIINDIVDKESLKQSDSEKIKKAIESHENFSKQDKDYLKKFALEPLWWNGGNSSTGGKTLDRGDALVSAILSIANLVNDSQSYIATLWKFFGENPDLANILNTESDRILSHNTEIPSVINKSNSIDTHNHIIIDIIDDGYVCNNQAELEEILRNYSPEILSMFPNGTDSASFSYLKFFKLFKSLNINSKNTVEAVLKNVSLYPINGSGSGVSPILNILAKLTNNSICGIRMFEINNRNSNTTKKKKAYQKIFYGSPGTGKSFKVKKMLENVPEDFIFRTTFHPDSDYSSFVGTYKPLKSGDSITYDFEPQSFTKAYVKAWLNPSEDIYLVIEEINRGNCAQIFGDLFQLLDRNNGISEYPVNADSALAKYLQDTLRDESADGIADGKLKLPANLNIIATMNTSDQSLFPMDSAFKRRWDWVYIPTTPPKNNEKILTLRIENHNKDYNGNSITVGEYEYKWTEFLTEINKRISAVTHSDDKQLGFWFVKTPDDSNEISINAFVSKVVFYLWNDVFKDIGPKNDNPFKVRVYGKDEIMTFNSFFEMNSEGQIVENIGVLHTFMQNLGLIPSLNSQAESVLLDEDRQGITSNINENID